VRPASRPAVVAFDVNETLFSLDPVREEFAAAGLGAEAVPLWFARLLRDGFALAATGGFRAFRDLAADGLELLLREQGRGPDPDLAVGVLARFRELPPQPDAEPAFRRLRAGGVRIVTLTNGHADTVQAMLANAGLEGYVEASLSVDDAGVWKPRPEPYRHAAERCGVAPSALALVAVHSWDVHGANGAGLVTGYAPRLEGAFLGGFTPPDVIGATLDEVAAGLLALPAGS
jgi:2-haloacid dehalogenase